MSKDIYVVVEQRNGNIQKVTYELISEATKLAADLGEQVVAVLMGYKMADKAQSLIHYGAQKVLVLDAPVLEHYTTEPYVRGIEYVIKNYEPNIVLFGASSIGRDMAPVWMWRSASIRSICVRPPTSLRRRSWPWIPLTAT